MTKTTAFTLKERLSFAVAAFDVTALAASLRSVARVNGDNCNSFGFGFVGQKTSQLSKAPRMQTALRFAAPHFGPLANLRQALNDNCASNLCTLQNAFRKNVVTIAPETHLASRKVFQVPFGTSRTLSIAVSMR